MGCQSFYDKKEFISKKYTCFLGNYESYIFFIEKATCLIKDNGFLSFVTPDSWVKVPQAKKLRQIVLEKMSIFSITTLPQKVFNKVSANSIIFVLIMKQDSKDCLINIMLPKSQLSCLACNKFEESYHVQTKSWINSVDFSFKYIKKKRLQILSRAVRASCIEAMSHLDVMQGIVPYSKENHSKEIIDQRAFHAPKKISKEYGIWIQGESNFQI